MIQTRVISSLLPPHLLLECVLVVSLSEGVFWTCVVSQVCAIIPLYGV